MFDLSKVVFQVYSFIHSVALNEGGKGVLDDGMLAKIIFG